MPLRNRVDPFGAIHSVPDRGMFTGNRGIIHDPDGRTLLGRRWTTKAWIVCTLEFGGRKRDVMGRNGREGRAGWTELFFLDEVTALAAGHRPCFTCRRERAAAFAACFAEGAGKHRTGAADMDAVLHRERIASGVGDRVFAPGLDSLPDGTVVEIGTSPHAVFGGRPYRWTHSGYAPVTAVETGRVGLVTPASTVTALRAGYRPDPHPTAFR